MGAEVAEGTLSVASIASMGEEEEEGGAGMVDEDDASYGSTDANGGDGDSEGMPDLERDDLDDDVAGGEGMGDMANAS